MARYSLWVKNIRDSKKDFIYKVSKNGKTLGDKADLYDIDAFTTEYLNEHELLCKILNTTNVNDYKLEIRYQHNKEIKKLDVAYFDDILIKNYSHLDRIEGKFIRGDDKDLVEIANFLLSKNGVVIREIQHTKYINNFIKGNEFKEEKDGIIFDHLYGKISKELAKLKLISELTRYKNIRGVMFFLKELDSKYQLKSDGNKYNINLPLIEDRTNIEPKEYEDFIFDEPNEKIETEFNFYDPYQRNYDENIDEELNESTPTKKSRAKVYTKTLPGQASFYDVDDNI